MPNLEKALRIQATVNTPGWADILGLMEYQSDDAKEEVFHLLTSSPEMLTEKTAVRLASRVKTLEDLKEAISDELKILVPKGGIT